MFSGLSYCCDFTCCSTFMEHLDCISCPVPKSQFHQTQILALPSYHVTILEASTLTSILGLGPVPFVFLLYFIPTYYIANIYQYIKVE